MEATKISWCDDTFNPWIGCSRVHVGCQNCYAEADMDHRRKRVQWGPQGTRSRTSEAYWKQPLKWNREAMVAGVTRRVFCASLADVFEDWDGPINDSNKTDLCICHACGRTVHYTERCRCNKDERLPRKMTMDDCRRDLFKLIDATPNLLWLLLTKRPENVRRMWPEIKPRDGYTFHTDEKFYKRNNVAVGTSISDQPTANKFLPRLLECHGLARYLFVSAEPLLGPVDLSNWLPCLRDHDTGLWLSEAWLHPEEHPRIAQVIIGGESGSSRRDCEISWITDLANQGWAAGCAVFVKQDCGSYPGQQGRISDAVWAMKQFPKVS